MNTVLINFRSLSVAINFPVNSMKWFCAQFIDSSYWFVAMQNLKECFWHNLAKNDVKHLIHSSFSIIVAVTWNLLANLSSILRLLILCSSPFGLFNISVSQVSTDLLDYSNAKPSALNLAPKTHSNVHKLPYTNGKRHNFVARLLFIWFKLHFYC